MRIDPNYSAVGQSPLKTTSIEQKTDTNNVTSNNIYKPQSDTFAKSKEPQKLTSGQKVGIGAAILSALTAVGIFVISKGKAKKSAQKALSEIPDELKGIFVKLQKEDGENFIHKAYDELVDYMGLPTIAPKNILNAGEDGLSITGGYDPINNTIGYSQGFFTKLDKKQQLNLLSHELKHCEQFSKILRSEDLGVEKYADAIANRAVDAALSDNSFDFMLKSQYQKAVAAGVGEEFIESLRKNTYEQQLSILKKNFSDVLDLPKFKSGSIESEDAKKYLEAYKNYEGLGFIGLGSEKYKNNPLELEAYAYGEKIADYLKKFELYS